LPHICRCFPRSALHFRDRTPAGGLPSITQTVPCFAAAKAESVSIPIL
jgi:hypothetical protein